MTSSGGRARRLIARFVNDPAAIAGRAWSERGRTAFVVAGLLPGAVRRRIGGPLAVVFERIVAAPGRHRVSPQLAFIAHWLTGDPAAAAVAARRLGTSDRVYPGTRRAIALLALNAGLRSSAAAILDTLRDTGPRAELLRAQIDIDEGRYTDAVQHADAAIAAWRSDAALRLRDSAAARLAVLSPDWEPRVSGRDQARLEALRGDVVPGRILHVLFASLPYHQAGYSVRTQAVARAQAACGLDPRLATRAGFPTNNGIRGVRAEEVIEGIAYYRLSPNYRGTGRRDEVIEETIRAAVPLLERLHPAALQPASDHTQAQIALPVGRALGIPVVYEVRGFWEETWASHPWHDEREAMETDHYRMTRDTETRCILAADAVVTLSDTMRAAIIERGAQPDRVVVIPNAVDVARFRPAPRPDALAASLGIRDDEVVVGYISTLNRYEGIHFLLDAVAQLRRRGRRVRLLLVGDGKEREPLLELARELGLDDGTLIMPGRVRHTEVLPYYSLIDVFVVPRTADRVSHLVTPLKPFEAMAMERPVVVSDLPALREIVTPEETGLTFRAEDAEDLANVLERLVDDQALRRRLGRAGRDWVLANRTWDQNAVRYRALYERLGVLGATSSSAPRMRS